MRVWTVWALAFFLGVSGVRAETVAGHSLSEAEEIVQDMASKLSRGVFNVLSGWGEVPRQMVKSGREQGWWAAVPIGVPAGLFMTVVRTGVGAFETITFLAPVDDSYGPLIEPGFVWQRDSRP